MMARRPVLFLLSLVSFLLPLAAEEIALPFHAAPLPAQAMPRQVPPIPWPAAGYQTPPIPGSRMGTWDDLPLAFTTFSAPGLTLKIRRSDIEDWLPAEQPVRYGFEAAYRWNPRVTFGLSMIRPAVFLRSLDTRPWLGYLAHLAGRPGCLLQANDDSERSSQMLNLMGRRTRVLRYEVPATDGTPAETTIEVFAEIDPYLLVFALRGPSAEIDPIVAEFNRALLGFAVAP